MQVRILIVALLISAFFVSCTPPPPEGDTVLTIKHIRSAGNGHFDLVYHKIPVITLQGTHAEIGKQHGALLPNEIKNYYDKVCVPYMEANFGKDFFLAAAKEYLLPSIPSEYQDEMREIANASKMSFDEILLINTFVDIASALAGKKSELAPFAGVSFGFVDDLTDPVGPMLARNMDLRFGINSEFMPSFLYVVHPSKGKPYMYVSWPGMVGTMSGMNLSGLVITGNPVTGPQGMAPGIPYTILTRKTLENCDTVPVAHDMIVANKLIGGNSYLLCDTSDKIWKIECTPRNIAVTRDHKIAKAEGELPIYTLSSFDIFVSSVLKDECVPMAEHTERSDVLSQRLSNLGMPWSEMDMTNFAGKLSKADRTCLSIVFVPGVQTVRLWTFENGDKSHYRLDYNATYDIINLKR